MVRSAASSARTHLILAAGLLAAAPGASASMAEPSAHLVCMGSSFVVRFNLGFGIDPLPEPYARVWSEIPVETDDKCVLSDGGKVLLKWSVAAAYPWGASMGDPPAGYSVWIDGKLVSAGTFKSGYGRY